VSLSRQQGKNIIIIQSITNPKYIPILDGRVWNLRRGRGSGRGRKKGSGRGRGKGIGSGRVLASTQ
jgi:hypothetical protein